MSKSAVFSRYFTFVHWFVQVNRQKTTVKKKKTYFLKYYVAFLFAFFEKVFAISKFSTARCLAERFRDMCILFVWSSVYGIDIFLFAGRKCVDLVVIFNKGREEHFAVSLQNRKDCVCIKYLILVRPRKLIAVNFTLLYSIQNVHNSSIAKKLFISQFFEQIKLWVCLSFFQKKLFSPQEMFMSVYTMVLTWTVHLTCSRICWSFF